MNSEGCRNNVGGPSRDTREDAPVKNKKRPTRYDCDDSGEIEHVCFICYQHANSRKREGRVSRQEHGGKGEEYKKATSARLLSDLLVPSTRSTRLQCMQARKRMSTTQAKTSLGNTGSDFGIYHFYPS